MNILTEKLSIFTIQQTPLFPKILMVFPFANRQPFKPVSLNPNMIIKMNQQIIDTLPK